MDFLSGRNPDKTLVFIYYILHTTYEERGKFLKKLWCCVGGKYNEITGFYQLG